MRSTRTSARMPRLSARVSVRFGPPSGGPYGMSGDAAAMRDDVRAFAALGVDELAVGFGAPEGPAAAGPEALVAAIERFDREVVRPLAQPT